MKQKINNVWNLTFMGLLLTLQVSGQPPVSDEAFKVIKEAYTYDTTLPLQFSITDTTQFNNFTRYTFKFAGTENWVKGNLAIPQENGPFKLVLLVDGMGGSKDRWFRKNSWPNGLSTTQALLQKGFAVCTLDAFMHGERSDTSGIFPPPLQLRKNRLMHAVYHMIRTTVLDYRRVLDYWQYQPYIDTSHVGVYGLSMGGAVTFILTSVEPRVKTAVAGVAVVYGNANSLVNAYNFAPRITKKPFMLIMGTKDGYYTPEKAKDLFDYIGGTENQFILFKGGHKIPPKYIPEIADWFGQNLK